MEEKDITIKMDENDSKNKNVIMNKKNSTENISLEEEQVQIEKMDLEEEDKKEEEKEKVQEVRIDLEEVNLEEGEKEDMEKNGKKKSKKKLSLKKIILITVGLISFVLGTIGVVLPILPSVPFYLLTLVCFANSSDHLHDWFVNSRFYKNNLEDFMNGRGMTIKVKVKTIVCITILMAIGFILMKRTTIGRIILGVVWVFHLILFIFIIKTNKGEKKEEGSSEKNNEERNVEELIQEDVILKDTNNNDGTNSSNNTNTIDSSTNDNNINNIDKNNTPNKTNKYVIINSTKNSNNTCRCCHCHCNKKPN